MRRNSKQRVKARRETAVKVLEKARTKLIKELSKGNLAEKTDERDALQASLKRTEAELATVKQRVQVGAPVRRSINNKPKVNVESLV